MGAVFEYRLEKTRWQNTRALAAHRLPRDIWGQVCEDTDLALVGILMALHAAEALPSPLVSRAFSLHRSFQQLSLSPSSETALKFSRR